MGNLLDEKVTMRALFHSNIESMMYSTTVFCVQALSLNRPPGNTSEPSVGGTTVRVKAMVLPVCVSGVFLPAY